MSPLLLLLLLPQVSPVKYTLTTTSNKILSFNKSTIESSDDVKKITIDDEFKVFDENLLNIEHRTPVFIMDSNYALEKIKSEAFADQEITQAIVITNTQVTVILKRTFKNLKVFELNLKENEIKMIESEAIYSAPNLKTVNLSNNKIVRFFDNSFIGAKVNYVDFAYNKLKIINESLFSFMSDETPGTVLLDHNVIQTVDSEAFVGAMLGCLNLRNNRLEELPYETFQKDLVRVYLQANQLEVLPESFYKLAQLKLADLSGNPLDCNTQRRVKRLAKERDAAISFEDNC